MPPSPDPPVATSDYSPSVTTSSSSAGAAGALADFVAGALGGVMICLVHHPFDTVKVLLQSQPGRFSSSLECARVVASSSPLTLFRGMSMPLATIPIVNAVVFWAYGDAKRYMETSQKRSELPISHLAACGAYAGLVNCAVVAPTELVKIQLQAQAADAKTWSAAGGKYYNGPVEWFKDAFRLNGWRAGFQGMVPSILRELPAYAGQFFMYEGFLRAMVKYREAVVSNSHTNAALAAAPANVPARLEDQDGITVGDQLLAGGLSGITAWTVSYPLDIIKTRVQSFPLGQPRPTWGQRHHWLPDGGAINVAKHIWRTEGMRGFWRGFVPCILPAFPANALGFVVYELTIASFIRFQ